MTRNKVALGILAGLLIISKSAAAPLPKLQGQGYDQARSEVIKQGFRPIHFVRTEDGCLLDRTCKRYPELVGCSTGQPMRCQFAFADRSGRQYVVITTRGENTRRVSSVETPTPRDRKSWPMIARH